MKIRFACIAAVALAATPALAQDPPNLVGTWKGEAKAVIVGPTPYRSPDSDGPTFSSNVIEYTYVVTEQQDSRFVGKMSGGRLEETLIGALMPPAYDRGIILDNDGRNDIVLREGGTVMDLCYTHLWPYSRVVACFTLTKQP
jgi:hypothetical protein